MQATGAGGAARLGRGKMRRIVVSLLKGGVAKSETAVSLAHGMALRGFRVLLVDTDVQAQCNDMLGLDPKRGLADVIAGWTSPAGALAEARDNLYLLAGGNDLAAVKMEIARREMAPEAVLDEALSTLEQEFDAMVIDTAPGWDTLLVNALYASREVLSPVSMEPMALTGLIRFEERLKIIQKYNPRLSLRWVVPTFVDGRVRKTGEIMEQLQERYGERLAPSIKYSVKLSEAPAFGRTIYEHDPKGMAAQCYQQLTARVVDDLMAEGWVEPRAVRPRPAAQAATPAPVPPEEAAKPAPEPRPMAPVIQEVEKDQAQSKARPAAQAVPETPPAAAEPPAPEPAVRPAPLELVRPPERPSSEPALVDNLVAAWGGKAVQGLRARLEREQAPEQPEAGSLPTGATVAGAEGPAHPASAGPRPLAPEPVILEAFARGGAGGRDIPVEGEKALGEETATDYGLMDRAIQEIRKRMGRHGRS